MAYILDRSGAFIKMDWDYDPAINEKARDAAVKRLNSLGINDYKLIEVAPVCFWYSTPEEKLNVGKYLNGGYM